MKQADSGSYKEDCNLTKPGRLLFVSANQGGGGSEELWVQTVCHMAAIGYPVRAATEWGSSAQGRIQQLQAANVPCTFLGKQRSALDRVTERLLGLDPWGIRRLKHELRCNRPDLVVFNSGTLVDGIPLLDAVHAAGIPYVVVTHLVSTDNWPDDQLAERIHTAFSAARKSWFVSEHNRDLYHSQVGECLKDSGIVRNPFLVSGEPVPMPPLTAHGGVKLALPARLHPRTKGQDMLFNVLARPHWRERDLQVSLFGAGGCTKTLQRLCTSLGLDKTVNFAGHVDGMAQVWKEHHALILPSRHEGLPIAQVEAMWAGRPVIATPAGGIPEVLECGVTGFLARACHPDALDDTMNTAWERRAEWAKIGTAAANHIRAIIPTNPVEIWTEELLACAADAKRSHASA